RSYDTGGLVLSPGPAQVGGPPIFIGSWGSTAGLRRVARLGDGWLASAYNTTPESFAEARLRLADHLATGGREASGFPNTLATMWLYLTDDDAERRAILDRLGTLLRRDPAALSTVLPIGTPEHCGGIVEAYRAAGVDRILFWPLTDEVRQVH